jgi:hypothetical protein
MLLWWSGPRAGVSILIIACAQRKRKVYYTYLITYLCCVCRVRERLMQYIHTTIEALRAPCPARTLRRARELRRAARLQTSELPSVPGQGWRMQRGAVHQGSHAATTARGQSPPRSTGRDGETLSTIKESWEGWVRTASPTNMISWSFHASSAPSMPPASANSCAPRPR